MSDHNQTTRACFLAASAAHCAAEIKKSRAALEDITRSSTAKSCGLGAWLCDEIAYLESIMLTEFGDGVLSAYKSALEKLKQL